MDKKYVLSFCIIGVFYSMLFSENNILWDFGVIIRQSDLQNNSNETSFQHPANQKVFQTKINAVIADSFIPPSRSNLSSDFSDPLVNKLSENIAELTLEKNIYQIGLMAKKYYLKKNYGYVIKLLLNRNLHLLSKHNRSDLEYLLADAFYRKGDHKKAEEQVLSLLKQYESDRLYLLLAMICESLGENNTANEHYLKLITHFPNSDYIISAKIKSRILDKY